MRHDPFVPSSTVVELLERDPHLEALQTAKAEGGRLVLVAAEAGGGKTALVAAFCATTKVRVLSGACDPLFTPRPLGPFADIAAEVGGELAGAVDEGARAHSVLAALLAELRSQPAVLVLEDLHWADEATLDVLRIRSGSSSAAWRRRLPSTASSWRRSRQMRCGSSPPPA